MTASAIDPPDACPNCGDAVLLTVIVAPTESYVRPCGCRIPVATA